MIVVVKYGVNQEDINSLVQKIETEYKVSVEPIKGSECTILGLVGNTASVDEEHLKTDDRVHKVMRVREPFKKVNRAFHPDNTIIKVGDATIGGSEIAIIAGPCSVESEAQITEVARRVKASGASFLRGGAYKPRSSPYSFKWECSPGDWKVGFIM